MCGDVDCDHRLSRRGIGKCGFKKHTMHPKAGFVRRKGSIPASRHGRQISHCGCCVVRCTMPPFHIHERDPEACFGSKSAYSGCYVQRSLFGVTNIHLPGCRIRPSLLSICGRSQWQEHTRYAGNLNKGRASVLLRDQTLMKTVDRARIWCSICVNTLLRGGVGYPAFSSY